MAITAYTGLPGSGKSYSAVCFAIIPAIKAGRAVVTNLPLLVDEITKEWPTADVKLINLEDFTDKGTKQLDAEMTPGALVVLDELWRLWPSGLKTAAVPEDHKSFLAEHRHRVGTDGRSTDIIFVTQDLSQIAAFARALVDKTYITQKFDALGAKNRAKINMYQGAVTGQKGPQSQHIRTSTVKYSPEYFRFYKSHTKSETGGAGIEVGGDSRASIWKSPFWLALGVGLFVVLPWSMSKLFGILKNGTRPESEIVTTLPTPEPQAIPVQTAIYTQAVPQPEKAQPDKPPPINHRLGAGFRLVGVIMRQDGTGLAMIANGVGTQRLYIDACEHIENSPDYVCDYEGQRATFTTGMSFASGRNYMTR